MTEAAALCEQVAVDTLLALNVWSTTSLLRYFGTTMSAAHLAATRLTATRLAATRLAATRLAATRLTATRLTACPVHAHHPPIAVLDVLSCPARPPHLMLTTHDPLLGLLLRSATGGRGGPVLLIASSAAAAPGVPGVAAYAASKAYLRRHRAALPVHVASVAYTYRTPTLQPPYTYLTTTLHLPHTHRTPTSHTPYTYLTHTVHLPTTYLAPTSNLPHTYLAPTSHLPHTYLAPTSHLPHTYLRSLAAGARAELRGAARRDAGAGRVSVTCALPSAVDGTEFRQRCSW